MIELLFIYRAAVQATSLKKLFVQETAAAVKGMRRTPNSKRVAKQEKLSPDEDDHDDDDDAEKRNAVGSLAYI